MNECIFCKIIKGDIPAYKIWEDDRFIAILDIFPETYGMTLVIPKEHMSSYILELEDNKLVDAVMAMKKVGKILDSRLPNIIRTTYLIEGLDVNHLHIKLIPLYKENLGVNNPQKADLSELEKLHKLLIS